MRVLRALLRAGAAAYRQGQRPGPRAREYFYYVDHQGQVRPAPPGAVGGRFRGRTWGQGCWGWFPGRSPPYKEGFWGADPQDATCEQEGKHPPPPS